MGKRNCFLVVGTLCLTLASGCVFTHGDGASKIRCYVIASETVESVPARPEIPAGPVWDLPAADISEIAPPSVAANSSNVVLAEETAPVLTPPIPPVEETAGNIPENLQIIAESAPIEPPADGTTPLNRDLDGAPLGIIGEVEPVFIEEIPQAFAARIDTGAAGCSLDVKDMKLFERDGKPWVSFALTHRETGEQHEFERRVVRTAQIKSASGETEQGRPVVEMKVRMGDLTLMREFNLADRADLEYQVLIGRNLLTGLAVVDVGRSNTLSQ